MNVDYSKFQKKFDSRTIDCKTVGFLILLKISKEIGKAWPKSLAREAREPYTPQNV